MPTPAEYRKIEPAEDGSRIFVPDDDQEWAIACCDCSLVHMVSVHHSTARGVSLVFRRDDEETEKARIGRGLRDPLYVEGYDRGAKSRDAEVAELHAKMDRVKRDVQHALLMAAAGAALDVDLLKRYGWTHHVRLGWRRG